MSQEDQTKKEPRILFIGNQTSSFVFTDCQILQAHYPVISLSLTQHGRPARSLPRFILNTLRSLRKSDVVFCWFANAESLLPILFGRILQKKVIVVAGGYESANEPSINYGSFAHPLKRFIVSFIFNHADTVLAVSDFIQQEILSCTHPRRIITVYNGVDIVKFSPGNGQKEDIILTVARVDKLNTSLKGLRIFAEAAKDLPHFKAVIISPTEEPWRRELLKINPSLQFTGGLAHDDLVPWYKKTKIYCQLSYRESFGLALVEAMSCGCIPVTTDRGALPEVIGDCGLVVPYDDVEATKAALVKAAQMTANDEACSRQRAVSCFSLRSREGRLVKVIDDIMR
jgi:glycosyltransferase involved in cell wall biosynthesis